MARLRRLPPLSDQIPLLRNIRDLASWLDITISELVWLSNFHQATKPAQYSKHYSLRWIRKRSSGWRLIESPRPFLKSVQRQIASEILNHIPAHPMATGFVPQRSIIDFAKPHIGRAVCMKFDLANFFNCISIGRVCGLFRRGGFNRKVSHYLALLTTTETDTNAIESPDNAGLIRILPKERLQLKVRHLPQGAPTSPAIANLCAYRLDMRLSGLARKIGGVHYTRYADDMLFSGNHSFVRKTSDLAPLVGAIAIEEGFELNYRKTKVMKAYEQQKAGGIVLNRKINIDRREFDRLKAILHNAKKNGIESQNISNHPFFREHLDGRIQWVENLNPERGKKLRAAFEQIEHEDS